MLELVHKLIVFSEGLSPVGLWLVLALATVFILWLAYRTLGLGGVLGILLVIFFTYVLYTNDSLNKFKESQRNENSHIQQLQDELNFDNKSSFENKSEIGNDLDNDG